MKEEQIKKLRSKESTADLSSFRLPILSLQMLRHVNLLPTRVVVVLVIAVVTIVMVLMLGYVGGGIGSGDDISGDDGDGVVNGGGSGGIGDCVDSGG